MSELTSASPGDIVVLGKVVDAFGLGGGVKIHPFADDPQRWGRMPQWWLGREGDEPALWQPLRLLRCRVQGGVLVATLEGVDDRDASEGLRGMLVGAPREALPAPGDDEYYWADLVGMEVVNTRGELLGSVLGLIETAANDVLRVGDGEAAERLLPFVATVVLDVDMQARRIRVEWEADW